MFHCSAISATEVFSVLAIQSYAELNQWEQVLPYVTEQYSGIEQCTPCVVQLWWVGLFTHIPGVAWKLVTGTLLIRALCRIKLLLVTHVLVDTWMLTVEPVYKLSDVPDDLKWATNTCDTVYTHFQGITDNIYDFGRPLCFAPSFFYPSTHIWTHLYLFLPIQLTGRRVSA